MCHQFCREGEPGGQCLHIGLFHWVIGVDSEAGGKKISAPCSGPSAKSATLQAGWLGQCIEDEAFLRRLKFGRADALEDQFLLVSIYMPVCIGGSDHCQNKRQFERSTVCGGAAAGSNFEPPERAGEVWAHYRKPRRRGTRRYRRLEWTCRSASSGKPEKQERRERRRRHSQRLHRRVSRLSSVLFCCRVTRQEDRLRQDRRPPQRFRYSQACPAPIEALRLQTGLRWSQKLLKNILRVHRFPLLSYTRLGGGGGVTPQ